MKYLHYLLLLVAALFFLSSCEKDPKIVEPDTTTFTLAIHPKVGNDLLKLNQEYVDQENYRILPTVFRFYVSHVTLVDENNSELEIKDLALLDLEAVAAGQPLTFDAVIPAGNYKGIKFWIGLDSAQNASDPSTFLQDHPLSNYQGTFWTWNTGYRFVMLEGYYDTLANTAGPVNTTHFFNYHTGINSLYREAVLGNASTAFSVGEGENYTYNMDLDLNLVFYGAENINRNLGASTHTTTNYPLAEKFTENFVRAFRLSTP